MRLPRTFYYRLLALMVSTVGCAACGGDSTQPVTSAGSGDVFLSDDDAAPAMALRGLTNALSATEKKTVVQCFCDALYRSTLLIYHYTDQNAVLTIEFDNSEIPFAASGVVYLFEDTATLEEIGKWINNLHSDGLFINPAEPVLTANLDPAAIAVTSRAYVESITGYGGDEYEKYQIEFAVDNQLQAPSFMLNGFSDQTDVFLQIRPPSPLVN
jgi:hypothetical protein